jgi:sulfoxide reductase heme-binding subunit YedZ
MLNSNMLSQWKNEHKNIWIISQVLIFGLIFVIGFLGALGFFLIRRLPVSQVLSNQLNWLFAVNSTQSMWYITRSAGWIAYFLLWFSTVWGLALPSKIISRHLSPTFAFDFHEFISLLSIGFVSLHVGVLLIDRYLPYSLAQILVPFLSPYRPFWVGIGVLCFYLILLVTITFYLRSRIGMQNFRAIHLLSLLAYLGTVLHAFFVGTDSSLGAAQVLYFSTLLVVVFLTSYWIINASQAKQRQGSTIRARAPIHHR